MPDSDEVATVLEFFGIKLTTPNQRLADLLRTDISALLQREVREMFGKTDAEAEEDDGPPETLEP